MVSKIIYSSLKYFLSLTYAVYMIRVIIDQQFILYMALCSLSFIISLYGLFHIVKNIENTLKY